MTNLTKRQDEPMKADASPPLGSPLFVDLDGTLIRTDLLDEAVLTLLKRSLWRFLGALARLVHGRAAFKRAISEAVSPEIHQVPFRDEVLEFVAEQRSLGRKIILATAADLGAQCVADKLGCLMRFWRATDAQPQGPRQT